jgi:hypothetical protein
VKDPSAFSVSAPLDGPSATTAVRVSPPASLSLPSTPGATTVSAWSSVAAYASSAARGGWLAPPVVKLRSSPKPVPLGVVAAAR